MGRIGIVSLLLLAAFLCVAAPQSALAEEPGKADGRKTDTADTFVPQPAKGRGESCVADPAFMRRNHMNLLMHQRDETVHDGVRTKPFSLAGCVDCHAMKGADGAPVSFNDPKHFCRTCHDFTAVSIDCFECHASKPGTGAEAKSVGGLKTGAADATSAAALAAFVKETAR